MADPVSIVGLIAAIPPVIKPVVEFIAIIKGASDEVRNVSRELLSLQAILERLQTFLEQQAVHHDFNETSVLYQSAEEVFAKIEELRSKLQRRVARMESRVGKLASSLSWPFKNLETKAILQMLQRYTQLFSLTLTVDGCKALTKTAQDLKAEMAIQNQSLLDGQADILEAVQLLPKQIKGDVTFELRQHQERLDIQSDRAGVARKKAAQAICALDYRRKQRHHYNKRHPSTGALLQKTVEYQSWFSGAHASTLWCWGNPGCGKSVTTSSIIQHVHDTFVIGDDRNIAVVYAYCDHKDSETHSTLTLLNSLSRQLIEQTRREETVSEVVKHQESLVRKNKDLNFEEIVTQLKDLLKDFDRVYAFIDALDELPEASRNKLIEGLSGLESDMYLFLTSRPNIDLRPRFQRLSEHNVQATYADVQSYMEAEMEANTKLKEMFERDPTLKSSIIEGVNEMSEGIFLLAHLQIETLTRQTTPKKARKVIEHFGSNVSVAYDNCLARIKDQSEEHSQLAMRIFSLVCCARRPLYISEVLSALAFDPEDDEIDDTAPYGLDMILEVSHGLVAVAADEDGLSGGGKTLRLVHYSLQEYLETRQMDFLPKMQLDMSRVCLAFLKSDVEMYADESLSHGELFSFIRYACIYWRDHYLQVQAELLDDFLDFLQDPQKRRKCIIHEDCHGWDLSILGQDAMYVSPLHFACYWGLKLVVEKLLQDYDSLFELFEEYGPLDLAISSRDIEIVKLLLDSAPTSSHLSQRKEWPTPLHLAGFNGLYEISALLIERGARVNIDDPRSPLMFAVSSGQKCVVALMIQNGAHLAPTGSPELSPLSFALSAGYSDISQCLLDAGAQVSEGDWENYGGLLKALRPPGKSDEKGHMRASDCEPGADTGTLEP